MQPHHTTKLCECGCGQPAPIATKTSTKYGHVKGEPLRFIRGHHMRRGSTPEEVFWSYVTPGPQNDCWLWSGSVTGNGYGRFKSHGIYYSAHRFSYELHHGPLQEGELACHTCDTPACVNPHHLFIGTPLDNMTDKMAKGRGSWRKGEAHYKTNLTEENIREIRRLRRQGMTQREVAERYGVGQSTVHRIIHFQRWAHVK